MALAMKRITASGGRMLGILLALRGYGGFAFALAFQAVHPGHDRRIAFLATNGSFADHPETGGDYAEETSLGVKAASLPLSVELCIATVWVLMVCCMPLASFKYDGRPISKTVVIKTLVMLASFLGGIFLFTQILFFQSSHFDGIRSLTLVECVYLMSQVLTTVGYGDITPAKPRAQVFVALYVLFSLLLIANTVSEVANWMLERISQAHEDNLEIVYTKAQQSYYANEADSGRANTSIQENRKELSQILQNKVPPLPWKLLRQKLGGWLFFVVLGVAFYANYPGEDKTMFQSIYYSIITLSTVGFGAFTALTPGGKAFGAFWMLFGSFSLLGLVGAFTEMMCVLRSREKWRIQQESIDEDDLFKALPDQLDLQAFMEFSIEYTSLVQRKDLDTINTTYEDLRKLKKQKTIKKEEVVGLYTH